ncbi:MAG: hypothetical protein WEC75_00045 [Dehalococcoidia bacterium]
MALQPIEGTPLRFPPGRVEVRLDASYLHPYMTLYGRYRSYLEGLPVLRERDFEGRPMKLSQQQLASLNRALRSLNGAAAKPPRSAFEAQEASKTRLSKRLQHLS